jgi:hypothetical protein
MIDTNTYKLPGHPISRHKMNVLKDSAILSLKDFNRIKNSVHIPTSVTTSTTITKSSTTPQFPEINLEKALQHKQRLLEYDKRRQEYNKLKAFEGNKIFEKYPGVRDDDEAVRAMDKMCLYAKISTVRDKQLRERKEMEQMYKKKEEKVDLMVEIERLKGLKEQEDREKVLQKMKLEGKRVILDQIEDNKKARLKQKELEEIERKKLLKRIEEEQKREEELNLMRIKENEKKVQESVLANQKAILEKKEKIRLEREEDLKLQKYNQEKYRKEEEAYQEKKRLAHEKEMELQKLREKQEKAQDNQEILDAIRAKRAFDDENRKQRQKEKEELMIKEKRKQEMIEANNRQKLDKEMQLVEQAKKEKEEFDRIIKEHQKEIEEEKIREKIKHEALMYHNADLKRQIADKEEKEKINRREILEEGRKDRQRLDQYERSIEAIRRDKIQSLRDMNIDEKYIVPLRQFNLSDLTKLNII